MVLHIKYLCYIKFQRHDMNEILPKMTFNDKMTWSDHIDNICKRSKKRLDIISKLRFLLPKLCTENTI